MRNRAFLSVAIWAAMALATIAPRAAADQIPTDKEGWITTLGKMAFQATDYTTLQLFVQSDPEMVYAALRDGWPRIQSVTVRQFLIQMLLSGAGARIVNGRIDDSYTPNPHLLDILALGLSDVSAQVKAAASQALGEIAFREIKTQDQLQEWRKAAGNQPVGDLIDAGCRSAVKSLAASEGAEKEKALRFLLTIRFYTGRFTSRVNAASVTRGVSAAGLVARRRRAALSGGLLDVVAQSLKPDNPPLIRQLAVKVLAHLAPDDAALAKIEPDLRTAASDTLGRVDAFEVYELLGQVKSRWATDLLIDRIAQGDPNRTAIAVVLGNSGDARAIPSLIALYDTTSPPDYSSQVVEQSLSQLTHVPYQFSGDHDGDWWRDWWEAHKGQFPSEVRDMPIPTFTGVHRSTGFSPRRHVERRVLDTKPEHQYLLISPGLIFLPSAPAHPGLVVVLTEHPYNAANTRNWQDIAGRAWNGRYLVALVARPATPPGVDDVAAPRLVAATVKDAIARASVDSKHVYLYGEAGAGLSVYACSLEKETVFRGFVLDTAPFRPAQLPPLKAARGRRYYLLHLKSDRTTPYFLAAAAESLLKKQGAAVMLTPIEAGGVYPAVHTAIWISAMSRAVQWLEESDGQATH